ncbi:unnamed protein product [Lampetra planeri]
MLPAEQSAIWARNALPSAETTLWEAHGRLAELLHTVASLLAEISPTVAPVKEMPLVDGNSAAISQQAGNSVVQSSYSAAILSPVRNAQPAKLEDVPSAPMSIPALRCRLAFIKGVIQQWIDPGW